jgi:CTP-dependent riboflavin kinase
MPMKRSAGIIPRRIVEIATDVRLRDHFNLKDGDLVEIETFPVDSI